MQLVVSIILVVVGVLMALLVDADDMRLFGWILAAAGAFGLLSRAWIARRR
jgi:hypothetical protein